MNFVLWCSHSKLTAMGNEWESPPLQMKDPLLRPTEQPTEWPTEQHIDPPAELNLVVKNVSYVNFTAVKTD